MQHMLKCVIFSLTLTAAAAAVAKSSPVQPPHVNADAIIDSGLGQLPDIDAQLEDALELADQEFFAKKAAKKANKKAVTTTTKTVNIAADTLAQKTAQVSDAKPAKLWALKNRLRFPKVYQRSHAGKKPITNVQIRVGKKDITISKPSHAGTRSNPIKHPVTRRKKDKGKHTGPTTSAKLSGADLLQANLQAEDNVHLKSDLCALYQWVDSSSKCSTLSSSYCDDAKLSTWMHENCGATCCSDTDAPIKGTFAPSNNNGCIYSTTEGTFGGSFEFAAGDYISVEVSSGSGFAQCAEGDAIKQKSDACELMPLQDDDYYNAFGITLPNFIINLFGLEFDAADMLYNGVKDSSTSSAAKKLQAMEEAGYAGSTASGSGLCFAYPASTSSPHDVGFGASGLLVATCCISGTVLQCPCVTDGAPEISVEYLAAGFSLDGDLQLETSAGRWNGESDFEAAVATPFTVTGHYYQAAAIGMSAFDFTLAGVSVEISFELVGKILVDLKAPSGDDMKKVFTALADPTTYQNMGASSLPGAQITIDGAFGFEVALGPGFTFGADLGAATISFGMNMGDQSEYAGYSNGIYATAYTDSCLTDLFPPLATLSDMKCNGASIFADLCIEYKQAFYITNTGMGYATAFSMEFGGIGADFNAELTVNSNVDLTISGSISANIGDFTFAAATTLGFTQALGSGSPAGFVRVELDCGGSCSNIFGSIADFVRDKIWKQLADMFTGQEEQELQDTESQLANMKQRDAWKIKHRHHAHINVAKTVNTVVNTANTVASAIEDAANDFANLVTDWADIEPSLTFATPTITGDVCGWTLEVSLTVKVSNSLATVSKSISATVAFSAADMGDAVAEALSNAFTNIVGDFSSVWQDTSRRRRRRSGWGRRR